MGVGPPIDSLQFASPVQTNKVLGLSIKSKDEMMLCAATTDKRDFTRELELPVFLAFEAKSEDWSCGKCEE